MKLTKLKNPIKATRSAIREKAISRAQTRILLAGRQSSEFSEDELETIVKEEEDKLYNTIKEKGLLAALALLGINLFFWYGYVEQPTQALLSLLHLAAL